MSTEGSRNPGSSTGTGMSNVVKTNAYYYKAVKQYCMLTGSTECSRDPGGSIGAGMSEQRC